MAVTSQQIVDFLTANPGMTDAQIVAAMEQYGISPTQMATAVGLPEGEITARVASTVAPGQSVTLGDTRITPQYQTTGSGMDQQIGGIENITVEKTTGDVNYKAPVGSTYQNYSPTGEFINTGKTTSSGQTSFVGGLVDAFKDPVVLAALGGAAYGGLLGTGGSAGAVGSDLAGLSGIPAGTGALTAAESAALYGTAGATGGAGLLTSAGVPVTTAATIPAVTGALTPTATGALTTAATGALTPAVTSTLSPIVKAAIPAVTGAITSALTPTNLGNLLTSGLTTGAGLLQQQTSKEAAQAAQARIDAETAAAKQAAAFRPVGMTTRFGTSQFQVDPTTGQITSAGYTLSPEAKAAQDRFVALAGQGITQAEGAQKAFQPLQTGAQNLFSLGNQYLAQSPQEVAQNYLNQQMALLQPGRELELANLQNKLQQQGRAGLSVAQGGSYGATTPELQALYNARAMQEAQLAANAQQAGQQQVQFGAGLLGTGAQTMGNYYAGQQAAYAPYTTALNQIQGLETAAQQPFTMGAALGQQAATAGANVGRLGLAGAGQSVELATGQAATNNPYASLLSGLGSSSAFGTAAGNLLGGLFGTSSPVDALSSAAYGTGTTGFQNMLNEIYG